MKTMPEPSVISPVTPLLGALAAVIIFVALKGIKIPLLSNLKIDLAILIVLGMSICTQGGIGRIAATGQWTHPLAIVGYTLGASILILALTVFFSLKLPFIASEPQAFMIIAILIGAKILNAFTHYYLFNRG